MSSTTHSLESLAQSKEFITSTLERISKPTMSLLFFYYFFSPVPVRCKTATVALSPTFVYIEDPAPRLRWIRPAMNHQRLSSAPRLAGVASAAEELEHAAASPSYAWADTESFWRDARNAIRL